MHTCTESNIEVIVYVLHLYYFLMLNLNVYADNLKLALICDIRICFSVTDMTLCQKKLPILILSNIR